MIKRFLGLLTLPMLLWQCVPFPTQTTEEVAKFTHKKLAIEDHTYEDSIRTVILQYDLIDKKTHLQNNAIPLSQPMPLTLRFDEIGNKQRNYLLRLLHCNADWTTSILNDFEFLNDFNDFPPQQIQVSFNTKVPYIHYKFVLPKVKLAGNYLIVVYREGNWQDIVISKRLVVYQNQLNIEPQVRFSAGIEERKTHQQIDFIIKYDNYPAQFINSPREDFKVVIRQNMRWDNAIYNLKPFQQRELDKVLDFNLLDLSNNFKGLNEYRRFEAQSIRFLGFNLSTINNLGKVAEARLQTDDIWQGMAYIQIPDFNGGFIVNNFEADAGNTEADYMNIIFTLKAAQPFEGNVYVIGAFNQWQANNQNKMYYNPETRTYVAHILMKQGIYDYSYAWQKTPKQPLIEEDISGSHQATENFYEILVYHKPMGARADVLIGYKAFSSVQGN